jgi:DNA-binding NarL/FixJ family response regulator
MTMKVLLVDDHPLILDALRSVIQGMGNDSTVYTAASAAQARDALAADADFDLVLLDLALGDADGYEVLVEFRAGHPAVPVVVISGSDRHSDVIRCIDAGAMGFIPKKASTRELHHALGTVMGGGIFIPPMSFGFKTEEQIAEADTVPSVLRVVREQTETEPHAQPLDLATLGLTPRQSDVMALLLQGKPNKLIARELNLSVETVKDHVAAVLRALNVSSRTQAVLAVSEMMQGGKPLWRNTTR